MRKIKYCKKIAAELVLSLLCVLPLGMVATAAGSSSGSSAIAQGYKTDKDLQTGIIVQLDKKDGTKVLPATTDSTSILGVVVPSTGATVTLSDTNAKQQVFVANFGRYDVLVDTQNGAIKVGDYIAVSALAGVGMKADSNQAMIVGKAASAFNGTSDVESTEQLKMSNGKTKQVAIAHIQVDLGVSANPIYHTGVSGVPFAVQGLADAMGGRQVSAARIWIALILFVVASFIAANVLFSGVRSAIIAIGRNPLAKSSIVRSLFQVIAASLIIFIIGLFGVYLLLKL